MTVKSPKFKLAWPARLAQLFRSKQLNSGGIGSTSVAVVEEHASETQLAAECRWRGFGLLLIGNRYVVAAKGAVVRQIV